MGIFGIFRILEGRFARFGRFSRIGLGSRGGPGEVQPRFSRIEPYSRRFPRIDIFSGRPSDSRESGLDLSENRILFLVIFENIGFDSRESGLCLPESRDLFLGIFGIFRILEGRFARFGRFSRIGLDSRRGPAPILENRALFSKIPKNRPRFSRSSPDSRESEPIAPNLENMLRE